MYCIVFACIVQYTPRYIQVIHTPILQDYAFFNLLQVHCFQVSLAGLAGGPCSALHWTNAGLEEWPYF